jgi:hypothetical protein
MGDAKPCWMGEVRGNASMLAEYIRLSLKDEIVGYMNFPTHAAFAVIASAQGAAGVTGVHKHTLRRLRNVEKLKALQQRPRKGLH